MKTAAIIVAGGSGTRMGRPKQFLPLADSLKRARGRRGLDILARLAKDLPNRDDFPCEKKL